MGSSLVRKPLQAGLLALALIVLPFAGGDFVAYQIGLYLIYGIATQGVALCWGRLGFLPLGNALFFGLGAYLTGGVLKAAASTSIWLMALLPALACPAVLAWVIARLIFARSSRSGPYFSLMTLAMTMLGFLAVQQWSTVTGGFNGLGGIPDLPGLERFSSLYWLIAAAALACTIFLEVVIERPIGVIWSAIAQNEDRMQLFGYATDRIKADAYALSALLASLAGGLFATQQGIVTPETMSFLLSTEFVIWAAVGGRASPIGALLGAVAVGYTSAELRDYFASWEVVVGLLFLAVVRFLPEGLAGLIRIRGVSPEKGEHAVQTRIQAEIPAPRRRVDKVPSLEFDAVSSAVNGVNILNGLNLELQGSGIRAMIGPNGAGKTSAFNAMTGRLPVTSGAIRVAGIDVTGRPAWQVARLGVGRKLQIPSVFADLTVEQNLRIALWAGRLRSRDTVGRQAFRWVSPLMAEMLSSFPELAERRGTLAGKLSQGQRQALEFSMTVLAEPHLLLLDEPCAGLSPAETHRMIRVIQASVERLGAAALLIEHDLSAVAALKGEVLVLHQGSLLARGPLESVQADEAVRAVYSGARK